MSIRRATGDVEIPQGDQKKKLSFRGKTIRVCFGLTIGLLLSELGLNAYYNWVIWRPFDQPPNYQVDTAHVRLAVLGGSTSLGWPYSQTVLEAEGDHHFNLLSMTQLLLDRRYGYSNIEIDSYAMGGWPVKEISDVQSCILNRQFVLIPTMLSPRKTCRELVTRSKTIDSVPKPLV